MAKSKFSWRSIHKWVGLPMAVFLILFCVSGIILNHRDFVGELSVSRNLLPKAYHIRNYNNGIVKGAVTVAPDSVILFGNSGVFLADGGLQRLRDFNQGLPTGIDLRNVRNVVQMPNGTLWCATQFALYRRTADEWKRVAHTTEENRYSDLTLNADSTQLVLMSRSNVFMVDPKNGALQSLQLEAPTGVQNRVSFFKTIWNLHSGALFGTTGRIAVDVVALILIFLSVTGIVLFLLPYKIRRSRGDAQKRNVSWMKWNFRWHDKIGYVTLALTVVVTFTGLCLRPPLMVPMVLMKSAPVPGSTMDNPNYWHEKLRAIRWDHGLNCWLISTTEGFYQLDRLQGGVPKQLDAKRTPPVSPMGVTVFERRDNGNWLIGSFSGLYLWNAATGEVVDYFTKRICETKRGRPTSDHMVAGFAESIGSVNDVVFDYVVGTDQLSDMPTVLKQQPMALWNFALELHVGRCYYPFLGPISELFVFLWGTMAMTILISGFVVSHRIRKRKKCKTPINN